MTWSNVFNPVLSFSQYSESPTPMPLGVLLTSSTGELVAEKPRLRFSKLFSGAATKLGVGPYTDGSENSSPHCVLGTDAHSSWLLKGAFAFSLCRMGSLTSALFSCSIGRGPKPPQICPKIVSTP